MLMSVFGELGAWNWVVLGLVLLVLEIFAPGVFLLWIGIAALVTGALSLQLGALAFWTWQLQVAIFLVLALASAFIGSRIVRNRQKSDEPLLNQRAAQLIGRSAILTDPIREGFGRVRIDDSTWRVAGPDLPAGTRVRIVSARGNDLVVERE
ncbi:MAG TPA: NfeD family protein [Rhizobiaceae bacterium]|nr:NfeD family protein [Rhizobiaceae bacterium]